ncbi:ABC transporter substrate-binding protein [Halobacteriovorax sp. HLS]|uniref:substrate-binding periplasmic protein n=1 Tax=Halobacteriovorax sp. HLS TaxID=2234000 RepID=UPI000FD7653B|nr:transporter substrate-binding domain-containing protein [Halobacteriovorax sp. HLS]
MKVFSLVIFILLSSSSFVQAKLFDKVLKVCAEDAGWPPFSIPSRSNTKMFSGYNLDVLTHIFSKHDIGFEIVIRPWKRCLHDGISKDITIVLDAAKNEQRQRDYVMTNPIYSLTPVYFYLDKLEANFSKIETSKELKKLDLICGQKGYTFNNFGLDNDDVTMISKGIHEILDLVVKKRCSVGLARKEVLLTQLVDFKDSEQIAIKKLAGIETEKFYWLINKNFKYADKLKSIIDSEVKILEHSGKSQQFLNKYFSK